MTFRPAGRIDEDVDLTLYLDYLARDGGKISKVYLDMGQVSEINSCGVRSWILFLEKLQSTKACEFSVANEIFMDQVNIVHNVLGRPKLRIKAFEAPYFCEKCNKRTIRIVRPSDITRNDSGEFSAPEARCESCSKIMEFDAIPVEYFFFLEDE